ncbi:MAG: TonB-dependent receptor [Pseudomonadales bacterium]|nr:TonB-dependent receptor [Pseudomonadales bacterium]
MRVPACLGLLVLGGVSTPALAQETQSPRMIEEIVVTATRREESMQDVPIAVTAISGAQLERAGIADLRDLKTISASFNMSASQTESQGSNLRLRGVGTTGNNIGLESAVGVFLDGVYLSRPGVALGDLFDVEQIEVLRGPQGTLFGRNTSAGALNILTRKPDFEQAELWANATAGNFSAYNLQLGGNLPVIDDELAFRFAGAARKQDGFLSSATGAESMNRDRYTLRGQMLWAFSETADLRVIADYADADENCCDAAVIYESPIVGAGAYAAAGLPANGGVPNGGETAFDNRKSNGAQFENPFEQWGVSAELNWEMGEISGTYIGAYRDFTADSVQDDFVGIDVYSVRPQEAQGWKTFDDIQTWTHELRFTGQWGNLDWLVGAYYSDEKIVEQQGLGLGEDYSRNISASAWYGGILPLFGAGLGALSDLTLATGGTFGDVLAAADPARAFAGGVSSATAFAQNKYEQDSRSWSIFTHNRLALTDRFDLVLGLRYSDEKKDGSFRQFAAENNACLNTLANGASLVAQAPGVATGTIQQLTAAFMCFPFATPADTGIAILPATFDDTFEDDELIYTASGVYALTDSATGYVTFTHGFKSGGFNLDSTAAAGGADPRFNSEIVDAWEVGIKSELLDRRLRANLALFSMEMEDFQVLEFTGVQFVTFNVPKAESVGAELELAAAVSNNLDVNFGLTYADAEYPNNCAPDTAPAQVRALCGGQLTNAPEWVSTIGFNYDGLIGSNLSYFVSGNARWEDDRRTSTQWRASPAPDAARLLYDIQEDHWKVNLRMGIGDVAERWTIEVWGNNIFDEQTRNVTANTPLRSFGVNASRIAFIEAPRTYGVTFRTRM